MIKQIAQAVSFAVCGLALGGCVMEQPKTAVAIKKPPAADYQAPTPPLPPAGNIRAICYNEADLSAFRVRMAQQSLVVGVLQCQGPGGSRLYERQYTDFLNKFNGELNTNAKELQAVVNRKRANFNVMVTEIANRTAGRAPVDPEFCGRQLRAFEWALTAEVTSLKQVPSPYDFGPEMNVFPCPAP